MFQRNGSRHRLCPPQLSHDGSCGVLPLDVLALLRPCLKASKSVYRRWNYRSKRLRAAQTDPGLRAAQTDPGHVLNIQTGLLAALRPSCAVEVWLGRLACARPGQYGPEAQSEVACPGGRDTAEAWQSADEALVAEVHCKADFGRPNDLW